MPSRKHPRKRKSVATKGKHGHPRSTEESLVEDQYLTVVAQPQSEDVEGISPHVLEEEIPQEVISEVTRPHHPEGNKYPAACGKGFPGRNQDIERLGQ